MFKGRTLLFSLSLSVFIFFESLNCNIQIINTSLALFYVFLLFNLEKKELFWGGFYTGIIWFWWVGYSFIYYGLDYLIPLIVIGIGIIYGVLFYLGAVFNHIVYRVVYFFILSYVNVLGFNWFKMELPFINSYIGTSKIEFAAILVLSAVFTYMIKKDRFKQGVVLYSIGVVIISIYNISSTNHIKESDLNIKMVTTDIPQDQKWDDSYREVSIVNHLNKIDEAIKEKKDLIIFPETAFPVVINNNDKIKQMLLDRSNYISIVTGALFIKDGLYYNSTYFFNNGMMEVAHKVVLVPFGEAVPLPEKIRDWINDSFYNGAKDYEVAEKPTTFDIKGEKFRNAICFEATTDDIYKDLDTKYIIATSNNAWFTPSTQPALQRLLLKYYSKKYDTLIYSVTNKSQSGIIRQ